MTTPNINALLRARPRPCRYGAPLGARNTYGAAPGARLYSQRVRFMDGCYAPDGTYWGGPANLYAVFSADLETLAYYRAQDSRDALAQFSADTGARVPRSASVPGPWTIRHESGPYYHYQGRIPHGPDNQPLRLSEARARKIVEIINTAGRGVYVACPMPAGVTASGVQT